MNKRLKRINALSLELHGDKSSADAFTCGSLREHVTEVQELMAGNDEHWKAETMDIIVHGYLMLDRNNVDPEMMDALMTRRLARFEEKITAAIKKRKG